MRLLDVEVEDFQFVLGRHRLSSLTTLTLREENTAEQLLSILETCASNIQSLSITADWDDMEHHQHRFPVLMPVLTSLTIGQPFPRDPVFKAPVLEHLAVNTWAISETLTQFVHEHRHSISELSIAGAGEEEEALTAESLDIIGGLKNLKSLRFSIWKGSSDTEVPVTRGFFDRLAESFPPFWPNLSIVALRDMIPFDAEDSEDSEDVTEGIIQFVQSQTTGLKQVGHISRTRSATAEVDRHRRAQTSAADNRKHVGSVMQHRTSLTLGSLTLQTRV